jgi:hypothetical protein
MTTSDTTTKVPLNSQHFQQRFGTTSTNTPYFTLFGVAMFMSNSLIIKIVVGFFS